MGKAKFSAMAILLSGVIGTNAAYASQSVLTDTPRGALIKLSKKGKTQCGHIAWGSVRRAGQFNINGDSLNLSEAKLPLSKQQWQELLSNIAGDQKEITIMHSWKNESAGLAAALRMAYDIRSHGGTAWVLNDSSNNLAPLNHCAGSFVFKGEPVNYYASETQFWNAIESGRFIDARGKGAEKPPSYTWVMGSPQNAKVVDISSFLLDGKVDKDVFNCDVFKNTEVAGCDSVHKTFLAVEAAKFANCDTQPMIMPYWGLAGASRDADTAKKVWGENVVLNAKRSGNWKTKDAVVIGQRSGN